MEWLKGGEEMGKRVEINLSYSCQSLLYFDGKFKARKAIVYMSNMQNLDQILFSFSSLLHVFHCGGYLEHMFSRWCKMNQDKVSNSRPNCSTRYLHRHLIYPLVQRAFFAVECPLCHITFLSVSLVRHLWLWDWQPINSTGKYPSWLHDFPFHKILSLGPPCPFHSPPSEDLKRFL